MSHLRATIRFTIFLIWLLFILPIALFLRVVHRPSLEWLIRALFKGILIIFNVKADITGLENLPDKSAIILSNHISYLDIFILLAYATLRFTPKKEVRKNLLIRFLVGFSQPIYIERNAKHAVRQNAIIRERLEKKRNHILIFAEATTSNGSEVLPFKSALLSTAQDMLDTLPIIPMTIKYPYKTQSQLDNIAWYGDMTFTPHGWNLIGLRKINAKINIQPALQLPKDATRKEIAKHAEDVIRKNFLDLYPK